MDELVDDQNGDEQEMPTSLVSQSATVDTSTTTDAQRYYEVSPVFRHPSAPDHQEVGTRNNIQSTNTMGKARWIGLLAICLFMTAE